MRHILQFLALTIMLIVSVESLSTLKHDSNLKKWQRQGGSSGNDFDFSCQDGWKVIHITMAHNGNQAKGISIICSNGQKQEQFQTGSMFFNWSQFQLPNDDQISQVVIRSGKYIDGLKISTRRGTQTILGSSTGGGARSPLNLNNGQYLAGIYGMSGNDLNKLGFYYRTP